MPDQNDAEYRLPRERTSAVTGEGEATLATLLGRSSFPDSC